MKFGGVWVSWEYFFSRGFHIGTRRVSFCPSCQPQWEGLHLDVFPSSYFSMRSWYSFQQSRLFSQYILCRWLSGSSWTHLCWHGQFGVDSQYSSCSWSSQQGCWVQGICSWLKQSTALQVLPHWSRWSFPMPTASICRTCHRCQSLADG
jgi:hypothetical protein